MTPRQETDLAVMAKIRECLATPSKYGHSDLVDFLAEYLEGESTLADFMWSCDVTYLGSTEPSPRAKL